MFDGEESKEESEVVVVPGTPEDKASPDVEEKARKMGWTEKSEFRGDPDKWRSAEEFVERGENMLPLVKATVQRQEMKIAELERSIKEFAEYHTRSEQLAYGRALKDLKARQVEAVSVADTETFQKLDGEIESLHQEAAASRPPSRQPDNSQDPVYMEWEGRNAWVNNDKTMLAYAESQGEFLFRTTNLRGADLLDAVSKEVKAKFPDKFSNPRRDEAQSVEGATQPVRKGGKTFADMPREARDACERMETRFGIKRADYVKNYHSEEA